MEPITKREELFLSAICLAIAERFGAHAPDLYNAAAVAFEMALEGEAALRALKAETPRDALGNGGE